MMRAEAEGEGQQGMLYGQCHCESCSGVLFDFNDVRTIEQVIYRVQGGNYSFEAVQKGNMFYQRARETKKISETKLRFLARHPAKYALWYFNPYAPCPQHGMVSRLQDNLRIIAFMNLLQILVPVYIWDNSFNVKGNTSIAGIPFMLILYSMA